MVRHTEVADMGTLQFAKLHSPKMKSVYWQYFGYPTNEEDRIITKQSVVCTLCHKMLTNHGNTTNLRAHLQHRHKELFKKICSEHGIKVPPRKNQIKAMVKQEQPVKHETLEANMKVEYNESEDVSQYACSTVSEDQAMLYESMVPMTYDDDEVIVSDSFAIAEVASSVSNSKCSSVHEVDVVFTQQSTDTSKNQHPHGRVSIIEEMDPYQLQDTLVNMLVADLRNVDTLYDPGMSQMVRSLSGNIVLPSEKKVSGLIKELHSDKLTTLVAQIKQHSQEKPYSLGFDIWANVEQKNFLSIYYNYVTEAPEYNLSNQLFCTFEYHKYSSIETVLAEFNLENCTAAIVNYDHEDYLKQFLKERSIPVILSYDVIVDKCLRNAFALPEVANVIEQVKDMIMRYNSEIVVRDVEIPTLNEQFPWTYFELLKFFTDSVSWPEDLDSLVATCKCLVDVLRSLAITLDTLKGEEIPHSSMLSPITSKILNKKLSIAEGDDEFVVNLKNTISTELRNCVISEDHLTISALLDPRFHRLTNLSNFSNCLAILKERYSKISEASGITPPNTRVVSIKQPNTTNKKSNLELFFDIQEGPNSSSSPKDTNVENELQRYQTEVYVSLDDSPFLWWNKMGFLYGSLKQLACLYQCVPCVVNMNFKKPVKEQINEQQKRYMLTGSLIDAILFLHYYAN